MQELHLADLSRDDENIRVHVKTLLAVSCVPSFDVTNAFEILVESFHTCLREIDPVLDYWEDNYIGRRRRNLGLPSHCGISDRVTDGLLGTNN